MTEPTACTLDLTNEDVSRVLRALLFFSTDCISEAARYGYKGHTGAEGALTDESAAGYALRNRIMSQVSRPTAISA